MAVCLVVHPIAYAQASKPNWKPVRLSPYRQDRNGRVSVISSDEQQKKITNRGYISRVARESSDVAL